MGVFKRSPGTMVLGAVGLMTGLVSAAPKGVAADTLSAWDLAGSGQGFREMTVDLSSDITATTATGTETLDILGGLDRLPTDAGTADTKSFRIQTVPDSLPASASATSTLPSATTPTPLTSLSSVPEVVPDIHLQPVPTTLSGAGLLPRSRLTPVSAPTTQTAPVGVTPTSTNTTLNTGASGSGSSGTGTSGSPSSTQTVPQARNRTQAQGRAQAGTAAQEAPSQDDQKATLIRADELARDADLGTYTARGNVELTSGQRTVLADAVVYNERTDMVTANGNVRVIEADGTTYFANYAKLTSDFKDGFIRDMSVLLDDRSRIAAVYATRTGGTRKDFWKGVYTPCDTCPTVDGSPWPTLSGDNQKGGRELQRPLWQIRAAHVTHDEEAHDIIYRDATFELFGVPIAYTPYMSQPDPSVYRRSGLLSPSFGTDDQIGTWIEIPYYYAIDDHQDATVAIRAMTSDGWLLHPEYRRRFADGEFYFNGSITNDDDDGLSGHLNAHGAWDINDVWRAGFESAYASSDTYLDTYGFSNPTWLTNHAWLEALQGRNYAALELLSYTDNRLGRDDDGNPYVLPLMTYDYISDPGTWGDTVRFNSELQSIYRVEGADSTRLSSSLGWTLPGTTDWGLAYEMSTAFNTDLYWIHDANVDDDDDTSGFSGSLARLYPSALMTLRYPLISGGVGNTQTLEPIVSLGLAPPGLNTHHIPNEDSRDATLTATNLFSGNRFSGRDRVDDGVRVNYGLRWNWLGDNGYRVGVQFGQAYRLTDASDFFPDDAGYGKGLSDYVAQLDASPSPYLDLFYRVRLDKDDLSPTANVIGFNAGPSVLRVGGTYVSAPAYDEDDETDLERRQEFVGNVNLAFSRFWRTWVGARYNVRESRVVDAWAGLTYEDECLALGLNYTSNYNELNGEKVGQSVVMQITLKSLGEINF